MQFQIWRCVKLYQDVSKGPRVLILIFLSLLSLVYVGMSNFISTPPFKLLLMNNTRIRCPVVHQLCLVLVQLGLRDGAHLHSRQYHTCSVACFPTHLPSKTRSKCPRSRTWISIHQRYHHVCRIFGTDGHFQWPIHHYGFRTPGSVGFPIRDPPSYLCRWLRML